jgi:hypothetical protein
MKGCLRTKTPLTAAYPSPRARRENRSIEPFEQFDQWRIRPLVHAAICPAFHLA